MEDFKRRQGQTVATLREARGWTQEELAHNADLTARTVSRFENGHHEGRGSTLRKLAKALEVEEGVIRGTPPAPLGLDATVDDGRDQLDRIEAMLAEVLTRLDEHGLTLPTPAEVAEQAAERREAQRAAAGGSRRGRSRSAQG